MLSNCYCALISPLSELNTIDLAGLSKLIEWYISCSDVGFIFLGTTGERMGFSEPEANQILEEALATVDKRRSVVVNIGCNNTQASIERAIVAKNLGADAAMAVVPYYNFPPPRGIIAHFEAIAAVGLPIIAYHHPKRTGIFLDIDTLKTISQINGVCAIKEASGSIEYATRLIQSVDVPVFCGDDPLTLQMMEAGAFGTISVVANLIPAEWTKLIDLVLRGDCEKAQEIFLHYQPLLDVLGLEVNPITVKYALSLMRKCAPNLRLPLVMPEKLTQDQIGQVIEKHYPELLDERLKLLN